MFFHQPSHHQAGFESDGNDYEAGSTTTPQQDSSSNVITLYTSYDENTIIRTHDKTPTILHAHNLDMYSSIVYTYLVFSNIKFQMKHVEPSTILPSLHANHTNHTESTHHPILVHDYLDHHVVIYGMKEILQYLKSKGENLDLNLTLNEHETTTMMQIQTEIEAYSHIVQEKCLPFYLYYYWMREDVYERMTKPLYFGKVSALFRWMYAYGEQSKHVQLLKGLVQTVPNVSSSITNQVINEILGNGKGSEVVSNVEHVSIRLLLECLESLSVLLGSSNYFYGNSPSTLDAIAFGFLSTLYYPAIDSLDEASSKLVLRIMERYPNIIRWMNNIQEEYMMEANEYNKQFALKSSSTTKIPSSPTKQNYGRYRTFLQTTQPPNKRKYLTLVAISVIGFIVYLFRNVRIATKKIGTVRANAPEIYYYDNQYEAMRNSKIND